MDAATARLHRTTQTLRYSPRVREIVFVAGLLVLLEAIIFGGYFTGATIPQFDFFGGSNTEAYAWWRDGGFFNPPQWMPYLWGGYPAVADPQNSSYYLPVGIIAAILPLNLHVSAVISALHVAFGAVGMYVFLRRWGARVIVAAVGLSGWFFAAGFYSNASQLDIARGYAWLPWILLITSVKWPWHRVWAIVLGLIFVWQGLLGMSPGMVVALAYLLPFWIVFNQLFFRPRLRQYLVPALVIVLAAIAMTMLRYLPAMLVRGDAGATLPDQSAADFASIGTFLYPYSNDRLPSFEVMRSFFVPAVFLPLLAFLPWRDRLVRTLAILAGIAVLFAVPTWPWQSFITAHLPGMQLSRFRMSDFKFVLLFTVVAAGTYALHCLITTVAGSERSRSRAYYSGRITRWVPLVLLVALTVLFALIGARYQFDVASSLPEWLILACSSVALYVLFLRGRAGRVPFEPRDLRSVVAGIAVLAIVSGAIGAFSVQDTWRSPRVSTEVSYLTTPVSSLIAQRSPARNVSQRPARIPSPPSPQDPAEIYWQYGAVFYDGQSSVFGYVDLLGNQSYDQVKAQLYAPGALGVNTAAFWAAPGLVLGGGVDSMPSGSAIARCSFRGDCGSGLQVKPVRYNRSGALVYDVTATGSTPAMLNEAYYAGWQVTDCTTTAKGDCTVLTAHRGKAGQIVLTVPSGSTRLTLHYELPGYGLAWGLFGLGILLAVALALWLRFTGRSRRDEPSAVTRRQANEGVPAAPVSDPEESAPVVP